jgi:dihydrodipicolinate synthase/N-acetylneuraminate lyase
LAEIMTETMVHQWPPATGASRTSVAGTVDFARRAPEVGADGPVLQAEPPGLWFCSIHTGVYPELNTVFDDVSRYFATAPLISGARKEVATV